MQNTFIFGNHQYLNTILKNQNWEKLSLDLSFINDKKSKFFINKTLFWEFTQNLLNEFKTGQILTISFILVSLHTVQSASSLGSVSTYALSALLRPRRIKCVADTNHQKGPTKNCKATIQRSLSFNFFCMFLYPNNFFQFAT